MLSAVIDTNIIIAGALTKHQRSASRQVTRRLLAGQFEMLTSAAAIEELQHVLMLPKIRAEHLMAEDITREFCEALLSRSRLLPGTTPVSPALTRDITDTKWISLAIEGDADYLVTRDMRHLHRLKKVGRTKIVTAHAFLQILT